MSVVVIIGVAVVFAAALSLGLGRAGADGQEADRSTSTPARSDDSDPEDSGRDDSVRSLPTSPADSPLCVLVVEDEEPLLRLVGRMLEREGFRVLLARDGETGLARFREAEVDFSIVDLSLPGIAGDEVVAGLRKERPAFPVILTSGHPVATLPPSVPGLLDVVAKPYSPRELLRAVERQAAAARLRLGEGGAHDEP